MKNDHIVMVQFGKASNFPVSQLNLLFFSLSCLFGFFTCGESDGGEGEEENSDQIFYC